MKNIFVVLLLLSFQTGFAQKDSLALDERGKYIYYQVTEAKGVSKSELVARAADFLKTANKKMTTLKSVTRDTAVTGSGKFIINKSASAITHPAGEIRYAFTAEFRDGRYRFWLSDYQFIAYQRDRFGNFVPASVVGVPLERAPGKFGAGEWRNYVTATAVQSGKLAGQFKKYLEKETPKAQPKAVNTTKW